MPIPGVISEDLIGKEGGTWSASPVSQIDLLKARDESPAKPEAAGSFLLCSAPRCPAWPPETPKRPSEHLSSAPTSEEKHLGTERDSAGFKHAGPAQTLLQGPTHPLSR